MTEITINQLEDFFNSIRKNSGINARIVGYVVNVEERLDKGFHLGKSLRVHPGKDTLDCCLLDVLAMASDKGIHIVKY